MAEKRLGAPSVIAYEVIRMDSGMYKRLSPVQVHSHYLCEFMLVREGCARVVRNDQPYLLKPGEAVYFSPLVRHSVESADENRLVFDVIKFSATRLRESLIWLPEMRSLALDAAVLHLPLHMEAADVSELKLDQLVDQIMLENRQREFAYDLKIRAMIYLLMATLARFWLRHLEAHPGSEQVRRDPLLGIPAYIEQHLSEPLRVEDLAAQCGLSYPWFAKRFRSMYGISCKQFLVQIRVDNAELYLLHTDLDLSEISRRTGYTDCSHMVKDFRRLRNTTPGQFRAQVRGEESLPFTRYSPPSSPNSPQRVDTQGKNG